eukprot:scpid38353/ scgid0191/ BRCA1-associated protein; BRAP2; Impedes mitogenic signal propagation; RING finger protein 52; Renal carcinoma antigen NY-REN-63
MDKKGEEDIGSSEDNLKPGIIVRLEVADSSPVPKSVDEFFLKDVAMASAEDMEKNGQCQGQRRLADMEMHTVTFQQAEGATAATATPSASSSLAAKCSSRVASSAAPSAAKLSMATAPLSSSLGAMATASSEGMTSGGLASTSASSLGRADHSPGRSGALSERSKSLEHLSPDRTVPSGAACAASTASERGKESDKSDSKTTLERDGSPSSSLCAPLADFPAKQTFFAGNPMIEVTKGLVHLYSPGQRTANHLMVCLLAVPADVSCSELVKFVSPFGRYIKNVRIIRDSAPNQYMALIGFYTEVRANEFYRYFLGRQFNMLEPGVCSIAFVSKLEILKTEQGASLPPTGATELPNCPVCLEKLDESVLTALCNHTFHSNCLAPLQDNLCPLCRYVLSPEPVGDNRCMDCGSHDSLWICLICGHVGCGRYAEGHAETHFLATQHTYAMDVSNQSVWDYAGDNFVHRLVQSATGGKLVEVQEPTSAAKGEVTSTQKWEGLQLEYTFLLTSQLESQRLYFEEKVAMAQDEMRDKLHQAEHKCRELQDRLQELQQQSVAAEKQRCATEKKFAQMSERITDLTKGLEEEKEMTAYLRENQKESERRLVVTERVSKEQLDSKDTAIKDLEEQLRDVMFYIDARKTVAKLPDEEDRQALQDGHVTVGAAAAATTPKTTPGRSHRKKRR